MNRSENYSKLISAYEEYRINLETWNSIKYYFLVRRPLKYISENDFSKLDLHLSQEEKEYSDLINQLIEEQYSMYAMQIAELLNPLFH